MQRKQLIGLGMVGLGGLLMYGLLRWQPEGVFGFLLMLTGALLLVLGAGMWVLTPGPAHAEPSPSLQESPSRPWISWGIAWCASACSLQYSSTPSCLLPWGFVSDPSVPGNTGGS